MEIVVERRGGVFEIVVPERKVKARFSRIWENKEGVFAEITWRTMESSRSYLLQSRLNLVSGRSRAEMANLLDSRFPLAPGEWLLIVEQACVEVLNLLRERVTAVPLAARPVEELAFALYPLLPQGETSIIFGPGGAGKSYFALLVSILVATGTPAAGLVPGAKGPVLYLDWEANERELVRRLHRIARGLGLPVEPQRLPVLYLPCTQPLTEDENLAEVVLEAKPALIVVDSLGLAAGGPLVEAETAIRVFRVLRTISGTHLVIAHTPKHSQEETSVFGSVYFTNLARNVWELRGQWEDNSLHLGLFHRKCNVSGLLGPVGLKAVFTEDMVVFSAAQVADFWEDRIPLTDRIKNLLEEKRCAMRAKEIAEVLDAEIGSIYVALRRLARRGEIQEVERGLYQLAQETVPF